MIIKIYGIGNIKYRSIDMVKDKQSELIESENASTVKKELAKPYVDIAESMKPYAASIAALNVSLSKIPDTYIIEDVKKLPSRTKKASTVIKSKTNGSVPLDSLASTLSPMDIISDLTTDEVFSFYNHLIKYPLLGLNHKVGEKIFRELPNQQLINVFNLRLFRSRERDCLDRPLPFNELEMFEAPYGISGQGRFNVNGQGELYTCDNKDTALKEVGAVNDMDKVYEIIEWKLNKEVKMLDLSNKDSELVKFCLFKKVSNNSQEYILPNFLAQCAKYHGINGIKVNSTIDGAHSNYVFFDFENKWFEFIDLKFNVIPLN